VLGIPFEIALVGAAIDRTANVLLNLSLGLIFGRNLLKRINLE